MAIVLIRTLIVFITLIAAMRFMGKRQLGELELSELVIAVLISDLASHPLQDIGIPLINGLVPVFTLLACEVLITAGELKSLRFRALICGEPSVVIENGRIMQKEVQKSRITLHELMEKLRNKDISDMASVKYAILETDGTLNVILYASQKPPTAAMLGVEAADKDLPVTVVMDGKLVKDNLKLIGGDEEWLMSQLRRHGAKDLKEVYLLTADRQKNVYFAAKEKSS